MPTTAEELTELEDQVSAAHEHLGEIDSAVAAFDGDAGDMTSILSGLYDAQNQVQAAVSLAERLTADLVQDEEDDDAEDEDEDVYDGE